MASVKPVSFTVDTLDLDGDKTADKVSFTVTQTKEQSFSVKVAVDYAKDGFGKTNTEETKMLDVDTVPNWHLSGLKFDKNRLVLRGEDADKKPSEESIALGQLLEVVGSRIAYNKAQQDKKLAENAGLLQALQQMDSSVIGGQGLGGESSKPIGGLIGQVGTQYGSGGLGTRGDGWGGGGNAEGIGGLGTRGTGLGGSGYGRGAGFYGEKGISNKPIVVGNIDKSLIDYDLRKYMSSIRYAYEKIQSSDPRLSDLKGKVSIRFTIARDGAVSEATVKSSEWNHPEAGNKVDEEIRQKFLGMRFSKPKSGRSEIISYPFEF